MKTVLSATPLAVICCVSHYPSQSSSRVNPSGHSRCGSDSKRITYPISSAQLYMYVLKKRCMRCTRCTRRLKYTDWKFRGCIRSLDPRPRFLQRVNSSSTFSRAENRSITCIAYLPRAIGEQPKDKGNQNLLHYFSVSVKFLR